MLCQRLRRVSRQLEELSFLDVAGRIARKLIDSVSVPSAGASGSRRSATFAITQEELASVIGASRIMVNKVLNSFVELGLISTARKRLTVLDATGLNRIASYDGDE
jgi:CRP/FNR family cyclic AMP-dependent transcriptional regulator